MKVGYCKIEISNQNNNMIVEIIVDFLEILICKSVFTHHFDFDMKS